MINRFANLTSRIAVISAILFAIAACGGGGSGGGGFLPDDDDGNVGNPITITTAALPDAAAGADYTALVEATGGTEPYSWAVLDDAGTGFVINNEGFLTGVAPARGDYGLTLEVTDNSGATDKFSTILVVDIGPDPLAITSTGLPNAIDGVQYTTLVEAAGGKEPYSWAVVDDGGTGFTINNEGFLTGTAPQSGDYGLTLQVTDSVEAVDRSSVILTVTGDTPQPLAIATTSLTGAEEGKGYNAVLEAVGGQGDYQWTLNNSGGSGLQLRPDGLLSGTAPDEGSYPITVSVMDDARSISSTLILTVAAESSPLTITTTSLPGGSVGDRYAAVLNASGGDEPYVWTLVSNGGQTSLALSAAGILTAVPTLPGDFGVIYRVSDGTGTDQVAAILKIATTGGADEPLKITTTSLPDADRVLYAAALEAEGGIKPYTWSGGDTSDPGTDFQVNPSSGSLTGNTNDLLPGQYGYSVTVADSAGDSDTRSYVITIPGGDTPPVRIQTENPLPTAFESLFYTTILRAVGGSGNTGRAWSVIDSVGFTGNVPSFASTADIASGVLTWQAADVAKGNYLITIQVDDTTDGTSDVVTYDLQASAAPIRITSGTTLPGGVVGTAYSTVISAEGGGGGTETWSVVSVTPAAGGLVFTGAGIANGTLTWAAPVEGILYKVNIKVVSEDGSGVASEDEKEFELEILPTP